MFKLVESAQARWRAITGAHLVPLVRAGANFTNGVSTDPVGEIVRLLGTAPGWRDDGPISRGDSVA
jgi:hypothetical protein